MQLVLIQAHKNANLFVTAIGVIFD